MITAILIIIALIERKIMDIFDPTPEEDLYDEDNEDERGQI